MAVYTDRHAVFQHSRALWEEEDQTSKRIPTQFGRALKELGVTQIFARGPEAKRRVERANGTFQDRLVSELRPSMEGRSLGPPIGPWAPTWTWRARCASSTSVASPKMTRCYQQHTMQLFPTREQL